MFLPVYIHIYISYRFFVCYMYIKCVKHVNKKVCMYLRWSRANKYFHFNIFYDNHDIHTSSYIHMCTHISIYTRTY